MSTDQLADKDWDQFPDETGHFGPYGGCFVSETLMEALDELRAAYDQIKSDTAFQEEFDADLAHYVGRPSPVYHAERWSRQLGGAQIYLKREDLAHTGAHKINNALGQALLARRMGKPRIIAETGAGQHGVATATAAALLGLGQLEPSGVQPRLALEDVADDTVVLRLQWLLVEDVRQLGILRRVRRFVVRD